MQTKFISIHLSVEVKDRLLLAQLLFHNNTTEVVYLDNQTICLDGKTRRSVFNITNEKSKKVDYIGMLVNRVVVPEDFIPLKAGDKIETRVALNEVYEVKKGRKYTIQFSVYHPNYKDEGDLNKIESNKVEITY